MGDLPVDLQILLQATNISKSFETTATPPQLFLEALTGLRGKRPVAEAVKPLNLSVYRGQSVGILGRNGAGKSTLLGMLAGHFAPTTGKIERFGRVSALVGIGQHFNVNETGRYNARQFASIQGITGNEAKETVERIKEFSELGSYFDQPVKTYSSGMRARLSFSCATFVKADLIIIDEVLAVGDAEFRSKCYGHIEATIDAGQTYIMVSHSPAIIGNYCSRAIVMKQGELIFDGDPLGGMQAYEETLNVAPRKRRSAEELVALRRAATGQDYEGPAIEVTGLAVLTPPALVPAEGAVEVSEPSVGGKVFLKGGEEVVRLKVQLACLQDIARPRIAAGWRSSKGIVLAAVSELVREEGWVAGEEYEVELAFKPRMVVGAYLLRFTIADYAGGEKALRLEKEGLIELHIVDGCRAGLVDVDFNACVKRMREAPRLLASDQGAT